MEQYRTEYLRGYLRGLRVSVLGVAEERTEEHRILIDYSGNGSRNPCINSYARGYRDGFEILKPESPFLTSIISRPLLMASNSWQ